MRWRLKVKDSTNRLTWSVVSRILRSCQVILRKIQPVVSPLFSESVPRYSNIQCTSLYERLGDQFTGSTLVWSDTHTHTHGLALIYDRIKRISECNKIATYREISAVAPRLQALSHAHFPFKNTINVWVSPLICRFIQYLLYTPLHLTPLSFSRTPVICPPSVSFREGLPRNSWLSYQRLLQKGHHKDNDR